MELGYFTFAEVGTDPVTGRRIGFAERLGHLIEEIELADRVGLDVAGVGEHHRPDYAVSSPATVLAGAATRTSRIRLSSAVTVLSSDDPVRVFQQFATVDGLSGGRAEIMAGRGSFIESFPLFGHDLHDYDGLFAEKLALLLEIRERERVTWDGILTHSIDDRGVYPRPVQDPLPVWIAVGGTPGSVVRAASLGLPLAVAIIGGSPARFVPLTQLFRETAREAGHEGLPLAINQHAFVAETSQRARELFWPPYAETMRRIGRERGWPPLSREAFDAGCGPHGHLAVGSPQEVAEKILWAHELFGMERFCAQLSVGPMEHGHLMHAIELFGTEVAPIVRAEVARRQEAPAPAEA